jgi:hydroxymethylpyrimidine/phosphomethylpyrimidine kinase
VVYAVKTGMLGSTELGTVLLDWLRPLRVPLVVDPLAKTSSGGWLWPTESPEQVRHWILTALLPAATVATPNWLELAWLSGRAPADLATLDAALAAAQQLPCAVVLKGGHAPSPWHGRDWVVNQGQVVALPDHPRWQGERRGTGCRFATALAIGLAAGEDLPTAAAHAGAAVAAAVTAG